MGSSDHTRVGGSSFHVSDCHIWAEIHYLDSPTDYREYLPADGLRNWAPMESPLVMLDDERPNLWSVPARLSYIFVVCVSGILALVSFLLLKH